MSIQTLRFLNSKLGNIKIKELGEREIKENIVNIYFSTQDSQIKKELKRLL